MEQEKERWRREAEADGMRGVCMMGGNREKKKIELEGERQGDGEEGEAEG